LLTGCYLHLGCGFSTGRGREVDYDAMREGWEVLRDTILPEFIAEHPGQRPFAWWLFDSPERRQRSDGIVHPFDDRKRKQHVDEVSRRHPQFRDEAHRLFYGKPNCLCCPDDFVAQYESELEYLDRLGLLTDAELQELFA